MAETLQLPGICAALAVTLHVSTDIVGVADTTVLCAITDVPDEKGGFTARQYTTFKHPYHVVIKTV